MSERIAKCPDCDYDQSGTVAIWTSECPLAGTCVECGGSFLWREAFLERGVYFEDFASPRGGLLASLVVHIFPLVMRKRVSAERFSLWRAGLMAILGFLFWQAVMSALLTWGWRSAIAPMQVASLASTLDIWMWPWGVRWECGLADGGAWDMEGANTASVIVLAVVWLCEVLGIVLASGRRWRTQLRTVFRAALRVIPAVSAALVTFVLTCAITIAIVAPTSADCARISSEVIPICQFGSVLTCFAIGWWRGLRDARVARHPIRAAILLQLIPIGMFAAMLVVANVIGRALP